MENPLKMDDLGVPGFLWKPLNHVGQVYLEETMVLPCLTISFMKDGDNSQRLIFGSYHPMPAEMREVCAGLLVVYHISHRFPLTILVGPV